MRGKQAFLWTNWAYRDIYFEWHTVKWKVCGIVSEPLVWVLYCESVDRKQHLLLCAVAAEPTVSPRAVSAAVHASVRTLVRPTFNFYFYFLNVSNCLTCVEDKCEKWPGRKGKWTRIKFSSCLRPTCVGLNRRTCASDPRSATFPFVTGSSSCGPAGHSSTWRLWASQSLTRQEEETQGEWSQSYNAVI